MKGITQFLVVALSCSSVSPVFAMTDKEMAEIINNYGSVMAENAENIVTNIDHLPYPKATIKQAILRAIPMVDDKTCEFLRAGYVALANFQDVKDLPFVEKIPENFYHTGDDTLFNLINALQERIEYSLPFQELVTNEMRLLLQEVPKC